LAHQPWRGFVPSMSSGLQTVLTWAMGQSPLQMCGPSGSGDNDNAASAEISLHGLDGNGEIVVEPGRSDDAGGCGGSHQYCSSSFSVLPDSPNRLWDAEDSVRPSGSYLSPGEIDRIFGNEMCPICWEPLQSRAQTITLCGHIFHRACLNRYGGSTCPKCRKPIDDPESSTQHSPAVPSQAAVSSSLQASGLRQSGLTVGALVVIHGLHNHTELNGTQCCIVQCQEHAERYEVRSRTSGQLYRVKAANLTTTHEHSTTSLHSSGDRVQTDLVTREYLSAGSLELVPAELSTPSSLPNDGPPILQHSRVLEIGEISQHSLTRSSATILEIGTVVRLIDLRTAVRFNGLKAEITSVVDRDRGRYEIRLEDGRVKTIARTNMEIICLAEATSVMEQL